MGGLVHFDVQGVPLSDKHMIENLFKLLLACLMGSIIGLERGNKKRPAGLRTNALVCVGSTLIMIISFEIFNEYHHMANFDPARLGAQVISGIGFLGAGTIMRNEMSVKGLTTAASLWVVASLGLAIGTGYYLEAIVTCGIVYFTLHHLGDMEHRRMMKKKHVKFMIITDDRTSLIGPVVQVFCMYSIKISKFYFEDEDDDETHDDTIVTMVLNTRLPYGFKRLTLEKELSKLDGVVTVSSEYAK
jgi:putative Mg2+ transporter-C (MgtC) family protein